jgi:glycosyltransferase involved in cell wall biosynthesis
LVRNPYISILVPTKNEELTVGKFIDWCNQGFDASKVIGEIILADSSDDRTPEIALAMGARVVRVVKPGLGAAYAEAIPYTRGQIIILGDADCTYDFREIQNFIDAIEKGADFVIGSRFKGNMEKGAMPLHHKYFGSPITTMFFDFVHGVKYSDIHSGMRALTRDTLIQLSPKESGWQYASEMLARANHLRIKTIEIPIDFLKAPNERLSHLKRGGWKLPFVEGIATLMTTIKYAADRVLKFIGIVLFFPSTALTCFLATGPITTSTFKLALGAQMIGLGAAAVGIICLLLADFSKFIYRLKSLTDVDANRLSNKLKKSFNILILTVWIFLFYLVSYSLRITSEVYILPKSYQYPEYLIAPLVLILVWSVMTVPIYSLKSFLANWSTRNEN